MKKKKVYLSGRMSGLSADTWRWRFATMELMLEHLGHRVVNPTQVWVARCGWLWRLLAGITSEHTAYRLTLWWDLRLLRRCDCIYMIGSDWRQSRGARLERMKAREWGIPELRVKS